MARTRRRAQAAFAASSSTAVSCRRRAAPPSTTSTRPRAVRWARSPPASSIDIERAVASARAAFRRGSWSQQPPKARKKVLLKLAELMLANREELALLETLDMGKPISDSLAVDIPSAANCIRWYAEAVDKIYDEVAPTGPRRAGHHHARTDGRGRRHRAVEFSAAHGVVEDRPGARQRQFAGAQALGEIAADRAAHRGAGRGSGPARRRVQRGARFRPHRGQGAGLVAWTSTASRSPAPRPPARR